jgi:hypothetical protein
MLKKVSTQGLQNVEFFKEMWDKVTKNQNDVENGPNEKLRDKRMS